MLPTAHSPRWHVTNWGVLPLWHQLWGLRSDPGLAFTMTLSEHSWLTALPQDCYSDYYCMATLQHLELPSHDHLHCASKPALWVGYGRDNGSVHSVLLR